MTSPRRRTPAPARTPQRLEKMLSAMAVSLALPEERLRIQDLLSHFPDTRETKVEKLLRALGSLWEQNRNGKDRHLRNLSRHR